MIGKIRRLFSRETPAYAVKATLFRATDKFLSYNNGKILGWTGSSVPPRSRIIGTRNILVGDGFQAAGEVWIEAVAEHAGEVFEPKIVIGSNVRVSGGLHISAIRSITIGNDCLFGSGVFIADHGHGDYGSDPATASDPLSQPNSRPLRSRGEVSLGDRCWIGDNGSILQGVHIGEGCIIGANSVVTKDLPSWSICVGSPAKVIRRYTEQKAWVAVSPPMQ